MGGDLSCLMILLADRAMVTCFFEVLDLMLQSSIAEAKVKGFNFMPNNNEDAILFYIV